MAGRKPAAFSQKCSSSKCEKGRLHGLYSLFPQPSNASFLDVTTHGHKFQILIDTGNLSNYDLIDHTTLNQIYAHGRNRPPIKRLQGGLKAAGGTELNAIGSIEIDFTFGDMTQAFHTEVVIVKDLGVPAILSAHTIQEMSMVLDLSKGVV